MFYAKHFVKSDKGKAQKMLEHHNSNIRQKDALLIAFFCGFVIVVLFWTILLLCFNSSDGDSDMEHLYATFPLFRFLFIITFAIAAAGCCIYIYRKFKVNYLFIFECDPNYKLTHVQLWRLALIFIAIWLFCFMGHVMVVKLDYIFDL